MTELADLTRELVSIPSHEDEAAAGAAIHDWLTAETDATVTTDPHGNVIARKTPDADRDARADDATVATDRPSLAFVGHHDVVPPDASQWDDDRFAVERDDDRLHGRGTADMKGAVAAALLAFRDADRDQLATAGLDLLVVSYVGEERGGIGCRAAIDDGFVPDYAVVGEGSTGYSALGVTDVAIAHKGRRAVTVHADGEAAHASEPERGTNAVYRACDAVETLRSLDPPSGEVFGESVEGSLVVTRIGGGDAWNVIPESCEVTVDERTVPGDRANLDRVTASGVTVDVEQDLPPMACDDRAFAESVLAAARDAHERDESGTIPRHVVKPHATDAGWLAAAGTTTVVCGPAEPGEAHTDSESVSLPVLDRCARIYRTVLDHAPFDRSSQSRKPD